LRLTHWLLVGCFVPSAGASVVRDTQRRYPVPMLPIVAAFAALPVGSLGGRLLRRAGAVLANYQIVSRSPNG
jgi:hypothetical protein